MSRRSDIDWVRTVSICSVVLLHTSALFTARMSRAALLGVTPALLCNQAARFCVPVFFMLSGLGLGLSAKPVKLPDFWLRRLRRTAVPYILWSVFYFLLDRKFYLNDLLSVGTLRNIGALLLSGGATSHLWFIPVLLQLYFLYPGLKLLMKRYPLPTLLGTFLLGMFATLVIYVPFPITGWWVSRLWRMFPPWIFYFTLGMALTEERLERIRGAVKSRAVFLILVTAAAALVYAWDAKHSGNTESVKPQLFVYSPLCFAALQSSWKLLERIPGLNAVSGFIARHSMTVYFSHIFFLRLLRKIDFFNKNVLTMLVTFVLVTALSVLTAAVSELPARLMKRTKSRKAAGG